MANQLKSIKLKLLKLNVYIYYGLKLIMARLFNSDSNFIKRVVYYPAIFDLGILADVVNRASWYFPETRLSDVTISIPIKDNLIGTKIECLEHPSSQYNCIGKNSNINLISKDMIDLATADAIMLWDAEHAWDASIIRNLFKVNIVDPYYYFSVEADTNSRMFYSTLSSNAKNQMIKLSKRNYERLLKKVKKYNCAYVFGTGPSLDRANEFDYSDGFNLICNSIVKNNVLLDQIKPHLLVFGDPQFHISLCNYADAFRKNVLDAVDKYGCYILTEHYHMPFLLAHYPELSDRLIGIEAPGVWEMSIREIAEMVLKRPHKIPWFDKIPGHNEKYNLPSLDKFYVRLTGSVLPSFMIPVASYACDTVYIIGADGRDPNGRKPDSTYVWSYSPAAQFEDLMQTAFDTHPSYFRDRPFIDDYDMYCQNFEDLLLYGESISKKYYSLVPSHIPAVAKRLC